VGRETIKMADPDPIPEVKSGSWGIFQRDARVISNWLRAWMRNLTNWFFAFTQPAAHRRMLLLLVSALLFWVILAVTLFPQGRPDESLFNQLLSAFFSGRILRHFLVIGLGFGLALILTAVYLDDIFELENLYVAELFIIEAAFALFYRRIRIQDGAIDPEHQNSPIVQIGGPGIVDVHLENAALFEKVDGSPRVVKPTITRPIVLDGFERLRQVVDLRDQVVELTVTGRTQDGIPITAKDVRLVFSIYRGEVKHESQSTFIQPYPFSEQAVLDLVYKQESRPWVEGMRRMIRSELRQFISQHSLSEFLTTSNIEITTSLVPREEISDLFFDFASGFSERAQERGIELQWIGVGTWVLPSQIIPERHLEAWRLSYETRVRKNPLTLQRIREENRLAELLRLVDEITTTFYSLIGEQVSNEVVMSTLIKSYREKIRSARDLYLTSEQPVPPEMESVLRHLEGISIANVERQE
jgi:hypothetical protein